MSYPYGSFKEYVLASGQSPSDIPDYYERHEKVMQEVNNERRRQDQKWGVQDHDDPLWHVIEGEEFGEVAEAIFEGNEDGVREELIQVAAVAVAWVEAIDRRRKRRNPPVRRQDEHPHTSTCPGDESGCSGGCLM